LPETNKTLKQLFTDYIHKNKRYLNQGEAIIIVKEWLKQNCKLDGCWEWLFYNSPSRLQTERKHDELC
jgi:hypothetical protein